jgi:hypothetical protein
VTLEWPERMRTNSSQTVTLTFQPVVDDDGAVQATITLVADEESAAVATVVVIPQPDEIIPGKRGVIFELAEVEAFLESSNLTLKPLETDPRKLVVTDPIEWTWSISSESEGKHDLEVVLDAIWHSPDEEEYKLNMWNHSMQVHAEEPFQVMDLPVLTITSTFFGQGILVSAAGWLFTRWRAQRTAAVPHRTASTPRTITHQAIASKTDSPRAVARKRTKARRRQR